MFSSRGNSQYINDTVSSNSRLDNIPSLTPDTKPDFAKLKSYIIYLLIIVTLSIAIAAYIKQKNNSPKDTEISLLENTSNKIFMGDNSNAKQINLFLYHWGNLSKSEQRKLQNYPWFQQFAAELQDRIAHNRESGDSNAFQHKNNTDLLHTLAIVIDARHVRNTGVAAHSRPAVSNSKRNIKRFQDANKLNTASTAVKRNINHNQIERSIKHTASTTNIASPTTTNTHTMEKHSHTQTKSHETKLSTVTSKSKNRFPQHSTHRRTALNSSKAFVKHKSNKITLHRTHTRKGFSSKPTPAELDKVVNQYVDAYEQGNVQKILSLLSLNARTNSANNAKEIEANLTKLFSSTKDRQLFIRNIKWKFKKNIAKGVGDIQTLTLPKDDSGVIATKGMIQIIAKKINNTVLVTHIYTTKHPQ